MVRFMHLNCAGTVMDGSYSVDVNFWSKPLFGLLPRFVCYLMQAAHGGLVRLPDRMAVCTAHVSVGKDELVCAERHDTQLFW